MALDPYLFIYFLVPTYFDLLYDTNLLNLILFLNKTEIGNMREVIQSVLIHIKTICSF
jgi:hypothetical protein